MWKSCIATDEKNVLVIGGGRHFEDDEVESAAETQIYSVSGNVWFRGPNMTVARHEATATCLGDFIYTFFGMSNS